MCIRAEVSGGGWSVSIKEIGGSRARGITVGSGSWGSWQIEGPEMVWSQVLESRKLVAIGPRGSWQLN